MIALYKSSASACFPQTVLALEVLTVLPSGQPSSHAISRLPCSILVPPPVDPRVLSASGHAISRLSVSTLVPPPVDPLRWSCHQSTQNIPPAVCPLSCHQSSSHISLSCALLSVEHPSIHNRPSRSTSPFFRNDGVEKSNRATADLFRIQPRQLFHAHASKWLIVVA